jgi:hypothetical protein
MARLDAARGRLEARTATPPITHAAAAGTDVWGVLAGPAVGGEGEPPVWRKRGSQWIAPLRNDRVEVRLAGRCLGMSFDDASRLIWCMVDTRPPRLQAVSPHSGRVEATCVIQANHRLAYVDATAAVVISTSAVDALAETTIVCWELGRLPAA